MEGDGSHPKQVPIQSSLLLAGSFLFGACTIDGLVGGEPNEKNTPPIIETLPVETATTNVRYLYDVDAYDPEGKDVTYSFGNPLDIPSGMQIVAETGLIIWTPNSTHTGNVYEIDVHVSDGKYVTEQDYFLTVN